MYIGLGACALSRERWVLGGFLLALSTMIRAFPAITLVSAAFPALWWLFFVAMVLLSCRQKSLERAAIAGLILVPVVFYAANYYIHIVCFLLLLAVERPVRKGEVGVPVSAPDAWVWLILLGLCVAQYWTVLVTDVPLHFHLATVLLFGALSAIVVVQVRTDVREGRLDFLVRFFAASAVSVAPASAPPTAPPAEREPAPLPEREPAPLEQPLRQPISSS
jgi:hypothetical protein